MAILIIVRLKVAIVSGNTQECYLIYFVGTGCLTGRQTCFRHSIEHEPTNTLDLIITDEPDRVIGVTCESPLGSTPGGRAHFMLAWTVVIAGNGLPSVNRLRPRSVWHKAE